MRAGWGKREALVSGCLSNDWFVLRCENDKIGRIWMQCTMWFVMKDLSHL